MTTNQSPEGLADELERHLENVQEGNRPLPWAVHSGCSYRRIASEPTAEHPHSFSDGNVLHALRQSDGHPDLSMGEDQLNSLVAIVNAVPRILTALRDHTGEGDALLREARNAAALAETMDYFVRRDLLTRIDNHLSRTPEPLDRKAVQP